LYARGARAIRAVDIKPLESWHRRFEGVDNRRLDLRRREHCIEATDGIGDVYHLAAEMGGMGFIESNKAAGMLNVLIDAHMPPAAQECGARRLFFSSTACVSNADKQRGYDVTPLREDD
jgi:nucleoside-diphosphate-sugar epimerase